MKNSVIENFEKALAELCRSARKENLNVNLDIYKDKERKKNYYGIVIKDRSENIV
ncbi:hypothetical protein JJB61_16235 [Clostridium perfringens]|nr:hypothetical protein [Clostridium perfringens]MBO3339075.1 hypothetical protein [Clostridium perfringens]MBO3386502.1 hypothetical protein [Clostridium perfringens]MBO3399327.1 hypothetical protein [Clostridium perfringens]MBO3418056.1 hypothetical protein [Clostridium perfringens]MBO3421456.1 hypothetical protein [Clostridium perfringens]